VRRVFLVKDNAAFEVVVRVGAEEGANTAILEGVVAGDQVVAEPPAALRDGSPLALSSVGD
jgi:multidrug efflux pump subunit AcrA (membrane-fusion protein)